MDAATPTDSTRAASVAIVDELAAWASRFDQTLKRMLTPEGTVPPVLAEAVQYAVQGGGKRVRPFIATRICELCGGTSDAATPAAVAIECVHAFSLVHDDLPAMDDDDLRRGRPSCHKAFGEATAILTGDALATLAFEMLATRIAVPAVAQAAVAELARGTGWGGMIGGQTTDILNEGKTPDLALVEEIHRYKTARLFEAAAKLGAICAQADEARTEAAASFGRQIGLAFQIADDLLDVTGTTGEMGKAVAKDAGAGKQTYPAAVGVNAARKAGHQAAGRALQSLDVFGPDADDLRQLVRFVVERKK